MHASVGTVAPHSIPPMRWTNIRRVPRPSDDSLTTLADRCVQCGLCLPHCPTYALDRKETESPRGRIALARAIDQGRIDAADPAASQALDHCLGCGSCETVCPAKVDYAAILSGVRQRQRAARRPPLNQRILEFVCARPRLLGGLAGLARLLPAWGRQALWIERLRTAPPKPGLHAAQGAARGKLWLATGCLAHHADAVTHQAAIEVLTRLGWNVLLPDRALCCGTIHVHAGDADGAASLRARLDDAVPADVDAVVLCASGCFEQTRKALQGHKVFEVMQFLAQKEERERLRALGLAVPDLALHVPCTQRNAVRAPDAARSALEACGARTTSLPAGCCGAAGTHMLHDPERARAIGAPLIEGLHAASTPVLGSQNHLCAVHLQRAWAERRDGVRCLHPVTWLAEHLPEHTP